MQELLESLQGTEKYSYNNEAILCPIPLSQLNQRKKKRLKIVILNNKGINELSIPSINILHLTTAFVNHEASMLKNGQIKTHTCKSMQTILTKRLFLPIYFVDNISTATASRISYTLHKQQDTTSASRNFTK